MEAATKYRLSAEEYLELERKAETKSEFLDGEMFAMAGGTEAHSLVAANLIGELRSQLKGRSCKVFTSDIRLKVQATGLHAYPDVQVACGELKFHDDQRDTLLNPTVIVEVLSDSTAAWDRGGKFWNYRHLDSLAEYVLVAQDAWLVEHYSRQANGAWLLQTIEGKEGVLRLASINCQVPLTELYSNTEVSPDARPAAFAIQAGGKPG